MRMMMAVALGAALLCGCLSEQDAARLRTEGEQARAQVERMAARVVEVEAKIQDVLAAVKVGSLPATDAAALLGSLATMRADYEREKVEAEAHVQNIQRDLQGKPWWEQLEGLWYVLGGALGGTTGSSLLSRIRRGVGLVTGKPRKATA